MIYFLLWGNLENFGEGTLSEARQETKLALEFFFFFFNCLAYLHDLPSTAKI